MEGKSRRQMLESVGHISSTVRKQTLVSACVVCFLLFVQFRTPAHGMASLTFKVALPASVYPSQESPLKCVYFHLSSSNQDSPHKRVPRFVPVATPIPLSLQSRFTLTCFICTSVTQCFHLSNQVRCRDYLWWLLLRKPLLETWMFLDIVFLSSSEGKRVFDHSLGAGRRLPSLIQWQQNFWVRSLWATEICFLQF